MPHRTLEQQRAEHAWTRITALASGERDGKRAYPETVNDYARAAKQLPARILTAGLGQALAFLLAKGAENARLRQLHDDLTTWVITGRGLPGSRPTSLLQSIIAGDSLFLRRATHETLAYLAWLNRFAEAEGLGGKE